MILLCAASCAPQVASDAAVVDVPSPTVTLTRTPGPTRTPTPTQTPSRTPRPTLTPTPIPTATFTPTEGPSPTITLSPTIRVTPTLFAHGPSPTPSATFTLAPTQEQPPTADVGVPTGTPAPAEPAGGLPSDARRALELAADAMARLGSLHNDYTLTYTLASEVDGQPTTVTVAYSGRVDAVMHDAADSDFALTEQQAITYPDSGTVTTMSQVIKVGATYWTRMSVEGKWYEAPVYGTINEDYDPYHRNAFVLREAATAQWFPGESGHIAYTVDVNAFSDLPPFKGRRSVIGPSGVDGVSLQGTITGEIWLDVQTLHVTRQTLILEATIAYQDQTGQLTLNYDVSASQHDAVPPIQPPPPDQVE